MLKNSEILGVMPTNHSALLPCFQYFNKLKKGLDLWKFNNLLVSNEDFIQKCAEHIQKVKEQLNSKSQFYSKQNGKI